MTTLFQERQVLVEVHALGALAAGFAGPSPSWKLAEWEPAGRKRYFAINWIQLVATWAAFGLFLVALIQL